MPQNQTNTVELNELDEEIQLQRQISARIQEAKRPVTNLFAWTAPERDYTVKSKRWYVGIGFFALLLIVLAALTNNFILIFAIIAVTLVVYTINTIPPRDITHQITNKGLYTFETIFLWKNMLAFWITQRDGKHLMHIQYRGKATDVVYQEMIILIGKKEVEKVVTLMVPYVDYLGPNEVNKSMLTSWAQGRYIPLLEILSDVSVVTKDPKDSISFLKKSKN